MAVYWVLLVVWANGNTLSVYRPEFADMESCIHAVALLDVDAELERMSLPRETAGIISVGCHRNDVETKSLAGIK